MNILVFSAGILCILLGIIHSILGERLIFSNSHSTDDTKPKPSKHDIFKTYRGILWATWHLASIFGWSIGIILLKLSAHTQEMDEKWITLLIHPFIFAMFGGTVLVIVGTKGKHPGWIVLLCIGILLLLSI